MTGFSSQVFAGLVSRIGGVEAAAAVLNAQTGEAWVKSTISQMCSGQARVSAVALTGLEDALGTYPHTIHMFGRIGKSASAGNANLSDATSEAVAECGEAVAAAIALIGKIGADPAARARALAEISEAIAALENLKSCVTGDRDLDPLGARGGKVDG